MADTPQPRSGLTDAQKAGYAARAFLRAGVPPEDIAARDQPADK